MKTKSKNRIGRPPGRKFPYRNQVAFTPQQWALVNELAKADCLDSPGAVLRKLIVEEARRRDILKTVCADCGGLLVEGHCVSCAVQLEGVSDGRTPNVN